MGLETKDFELVFWEMAAKLVPEAAERGVGQACMNLLYDATQIPPKVPHDTGTLRGSGSAFVQNKLVGVSQVGGGGTPATSHTEPIKGDEIVGVVGFNTPYAEFVHNHTELRFRETGTGALFLETKLAQNRDKYRDTIGKAIEKALKGKG